MPSKTLLETVEAMTEAGASPLDIMEMIMHDVTTRPGQTVPDRALQEYQRKFMLLVFESLRTLDPDDMNAMYMALIKAFAFATAALFVNRDPVEIKKHVAQTFGEAYDQSRQMFDMISNVTQVVSVEAQK